MIIIPNNEIAKHMLTDFFCQALGYTRDGDFQRHFSV